MQNMQSNILGAVLTMASACHSPCTPFQSPVETPDGWFARKLKVVAVETDSTYVNAPCGSYLLATPCIISTCKEDQLCNGTPLSCLQDSKDTRWSALPGTAGLVPASEAMRSHTCSP